DILVHSQRNPRFLRALKKSYDTVKPQLERNEHTQHLLYLFDLSETHGLENSTELHEILCGLCHIETQSYDLRHRIDQFLSRLYLNADPAIRARIQDSLSTLPEDKLILGENDLCHQTSLFRETKIYRSLVRHLVHSAQSFDEITVVGCSEGHEAFSFALALQYFSDDEGISRLPIKAFDISSNLIDRAKSGYIVLDDTDRDNFRLSGINQSFDSIFSPYGIPCDEKAFSTPLFQLFGRSCFNGQLYRVPENILRNCTFYVSSFFEFQDEIKKDGKPIIVSTQNVFYLLGRQLAYTQSDAQDSKKYFQFSQDLFESFVEKLPSNSIVILGQGELEGYRGLGPLLYSSAHPLDFKRAGLVHIKSCDRHIFEKS
ncbi:MAG: hypothetical protein GYA55_04595, partial [SAR324 cluster bacterium]|nr:hypothetical protein [SAR324 cluster bacterium]